MKVIALTVFLCAVASSPTDAQFWKYSQQLFNPFSWIRQGKTGTIDLNPKPSASYNPAATTVNNVNANPPSSKTPIPLPLSYPPPSPPAVAPPSPSAPVVAPLVLSSPTVPISSTTSTTTTEGSTAESETAKLANLQTKIQDPNDIKREEEVKDVKGTKDEKLESKMDEIELGPVIHPVRVTPPPITTTNAKSARTTLSERSSVGITASTTKRALKIKSTTSPLAPFYAYSQSTRHQTSSHSDRTHTSPHWTTVPITTHQHKGAADKTATDRIHATYSHHSHPHVSSVASSSSVGASSHSSSFASSSGTTAALRSSSVGSSAPVTEATTTYFDTTTQEPTGTTEEPRDNHRQHDFYLSKREKPQVKIATNISQNLLPLPAGASAALVKPTKYHYYPHNQHIYLLPECAIQQVCNAVYVRLNWTQPLCACPSRYRDPCSASLNSDDQHTTELQVDRSSKRALTLVKTCEPTTDMRVCRLPRDWSLLALQNIRTGKSHYLVICRCPDTSILEGPMSHDQPTYASVPGIRVYGMMCVQPPQSAAQISANKRRGRPLRLTRSVDADPPFPWAAAAELAKTADWEN